MGCKYKLWSKKKHALRSCGKAGTGDPCLCVEHSLFVYDNTHGPFTKSRAKHPESFDWLAKAKQVYGIKPHTFASMGKPSDAGPDYKWGKRVGK
jgi:hypothetical protein